MSARLMITAGYLDIPVSHKLALIKICDSAHEPDRIGYPGLDALRVWAGTKRSRTLEIVKDLEAWGLIVQVGRGNRGNRASFKVFPEPGDEALSVAVKAGKECPGASLFKGVPPIPSEAEVARRVERAPSGKTFIGSNGPDPMREPSGSPKGPTDRTLTAPKGSDGLDPTPGGKGPTEGEKGSSFREKGSDVSDPFRTSLQEESLRDSSGLADADAPASQPPLDLDLPEQPPATPQAKHDEQAQRDEAQRVTAAWWDHLPKKPAKRDTFRNVKKLVAGYLANDWDADTELIPALHECGVAVTSAAIDVQLERRRKRKTTTGVARGNEEHWENGGSFEMPA